MHKVLFIGLSPGFQQTMIFDKFEVDEVNRCKKYYYDISGKCINCARVFSQLGGDALCLTQVGVEDKKEYLKLASESKLNLIPIWTDVKTRTCYTILDEDLDVMTELVVNEPDPVKPDIENKLLEEFLRILPNVKAITISGSRLPGFSDKIIPKMVEAAKNMGKLVFADYRNEDLKKSFISKDIRPDYIKINMKEFQETFFKDEADFDYEKRLKEISIEYNNSFILTQGAKKTVYADKGKFGSLVPETIKALNPIGCGDSFTSGLVMGILENKGLKEALILGNDTAKKNAQNIRPGFIK